MQSNTEVRGATGGQFETINGERFCVTCGSPECMGMVNGRWQTYCPSCDQDAIDHSPEGDGRGEDEPL